MPRRPGPRHAQARATSAAEIARLAADAYIFGYPVVLMDAARHSATTAAPNDVSAPINQFAHMRTVDAAARLHFASLNPDVLHSIAWLDVAQQPLVLSLPDIGDRYVS